MDDLVTEDKSKSTGGNKKYQYYRPCYPIWLSPAGKEVIKAFAFLVIENERLTQLLNAQKETGHINSN